MNKLRAFLFLLLFVAGAIAIAGPFEMSGGGSGSTTLTVGTTPVSSGTDTKVLYDNSGTLGEYTVSGSGNVCMTTSCVMTTPNLGTPSAATLTSATGLPISTGVSGLGTGVATALAVNVGSGGAVAPYTFTTGTSRTLASMAEVVVCTSTCTITPPATLTAGMQFCVQNDDNVSTVITLAASTNIQYEAQARTSYGTANKSMTSGGAVKDQICMVAISTTKYNVFSSTGTWTNTP